eukprot:CAMPEP_0198442818 /NCGR_PEP_ID=MMETSP1452-20131203/68180_1 /TAXON_ID=1181717 /ORGANISM="Synchroma pusillum, Strain CCMP3072" /LENGTH=234 /DNA_ID=CAMNT_0044163445 /DNA_START=44 /DNA_END=745 /DNA_ORIENTATION=-
MSDDVAYWDQQVVSALDEYERAIHDASASTGKNRQEMLALAEAKFSRVRDARAGFATERRMIRDRDARTTYEEKDQRYAKRVEELRVELQWLRTEGDRSQLLSGATSPGQGVANTNEGLLSEASKVQDLTEVSLQHTKRMIEASKQVGSATLDELGRQQQQIREIQEEVAHIDSALDRARKLVTVFGRRMMTDKVIQFFALVNLLVLLGLIIYIALVPDASLDGGDDDSRRRLL